LRDWKAWAGLGVSALLLWWVFRGEDLGGIAAQIAEADLALLVLAGALNLTGGMIRAVRWQILLRPIGQSVPLAARWKALNIGFAVTNLALGRLGEVARPYALSKMTPISTSAGLGTIALERVLDFVALVGLLLAVLAAPTFPENATVLGRPLGYVVGGVAVLGIVVLALTAWIAVRPGILRHGAGAFVSLLPTGWSEPVRAGLDEFLSGLRLLRDPRASAHALAWSVLLWIWMAASFRAAFLAFGLELGFVAAVFTQCVVSVFVAIPAAPGFIGTLQAGVLVAVSGVFGVSETDALSMSLGYHLAGYVPVTALGVYYAWALRIEISSIRESAREEAAGVHGGAV